MRVERSVLSRSLPSSHPQWTTLAVEAELRTGEGLHICLGQSGRHSDGSWSCGWEGYARQKEVNQERLTERWEILGQRVDQDCLWGQQSPFHSPFPGPF